MGLDTVETVLWAEEEFAIDIPDADASVILTVGEFSLYIHRRLVARDDLEATTEERIYEQIRNFLIEAFRVRPELITRQAKFVKDLGLE